MPKGHRGHRGGLGLGFRVVACSGQDIYKYGDHSCSFYALASTIAEDAPMLFPMYTVASDVLLKMTKVEPHEKLKAAKLRASRES